jgi:hypothetical protein
MSRYGSSEKARILVVPARAPKRSVLRVKRGHCSQCTAEPTPCDSLLTSNGEVEGPGTHARWRRGRTISQRPRRQTAHASRPPPTIVRWPSCLQGVQVTLPQQRRRLLQPAQAIVCQRHARSYTSAIRSRAKLQAIRQRRGEARRPEDSRHGVMRLLCTISKTEQAVQRDPVCRKPQERWENLGTFP